jgi:acyl-coenzyme A synthetase/AMP-(fatty) acid ligase
MSGGAPLDQAVIEAVYNRTGVIIRMGYGTTEHGSLSCQQGDDWDEIVQGRGTAGTPLPGVEFKIVSVDGKDTRAPGSSLAAARR